MRSIKFILIVAILCLEASDVIAKPFFNPFNVAIQTSPSDDGGQKISLLYPKKSSEVTVSFKSEEINKNMINFASLLSSVVSQFFKKFASLSSSVGGGKSSKTTTESNFDFDNDDGDSSSSSFSSLDGDSSSSKDEDDSLSLSKDGDQKDDLRDGYDYSTPGVTKASYSYPKPTTENSYLPPVSEELRYIPPTSPPQSTPDSNYLPQN